MNEGVTLRQMAAFCFAALSAPAVTVCAGQSWQWTLAASLLAATAEAGILLLWRQAGQTLPRAAVAVWGKIPGGILLLLAAAFAVLTMARFALVTDEAFPETEVRPFVPLTLLGVTAWSCSRGRTAAIRAVCVAAMFLIALYGTIFFFAAPDAVPERLLSPPSPPSWRMACLTLPVWAVYLAAPDGKRGPVPWVYAGALLLLPPAVSAICAAVPGSGGSFYVMAESVKVLSVAQRIEPLVSAALTVGWYAALCLPALAAGEVFDSLGGKRRAGAVGACALAAAGAWGKPSVCPEIFLIGAAIFCIFFPALTLGIAALKKTEKKIKKTVDNRDNRW